MLSTTITEQARQQEWDTMCIIARNNGFPEHPQFKEQNNQYTKDKNPPTQTQKKKWITFTYHSPLTRTCLNPPT
jgi:hypothetical protein